MPRCLVVFDIDGVLCWMMNNHAANLYQFTIIHPECPLIIYSTADTSYPHCFAPYLDVLMEYLISFGSRIVFFSAGHQSRNDDLIERLLIQLFGKERYEELKLSGQFEIFSAHQMRAANHELGEVGSYVKDLSVVLKDQEEIANSILIEDQPNNAAHDQQPCIMVDLKTWDTLLPNNLEQCFAKNNVYYLLGIFSNYFNLRGDLPPLRLWIEDFFKEKVSDGHFLGRFYMPHKYDQFVIDMIDCGLEEVRKRHSNAMLYGFLDNTSSDDEYDFNRSPHRRTYGIRPGV